MNSGDGMIWSDSVVYVPMGEPGSTGLFEAIRSGRKVLYHWESVEYAPSWGAELAAALARHQAVVDLWPWRTDPRRTALLAELDCSRKDDPTANPRLVAARSEPFRRSEAHSHRLAEEVIRLALDLLGPELQARQTMDRVPRVALRRGGATIGMAWMQEFTHGVAQLDFGCQTPRRQWFELVSAHASYVVDDFAEPRGSVVRYWLHDDQSRSTTFTADYPGILEAQLHWLEQSDWPTLEADMRLSESARRLARLLVSELKANQNP